MNIRMAKSAARLVPSTDRALGVAPTVLVFAGGALYTLGALAYALRRPNPVPATFGYHEIFHVLVVAAAAVHFIAIAAFVCRRRELRYAWSLKTRRPMPSGVPS